MGIASRLARHRAQSKAERGIKPRTADPPVIEVDRLALPIFQEQLAIIRVRQRLPDQPRRRIAIKRRIGPVEKQGIGGGKRGLAGKGSGHGIS